MDALLVRVFGRVQRVGFRRFVESAAFACGIFGHVENIRDGTVQIFAQGDHLKIERFLNELKNAQPPIVIERVETRKSRSRPLRTFQVKYGPMSVELQEGFGAMESEFRNYRDDFRDYRQEFRDFAGRTDGNFKSLDQKYGEISSKPTEILEALEKESTETRKELTRAVDNLSRLIDRYVQQREGSENRGSEI